MEDNVATHEEEWSWVYPRKPCHRLPGAGESAQGGHLVHKFHLQKRGYDLPQGTQQWKNHVYNPSSLDHSLYGMLDQVMLSLLFRLPGSTEHLDGYGLLLTFHYEIFKLVLSHSEALCINSIREERSHKRYYFYIYKNQNISILNI